MGSNRYIDLIAFAMGALPYLSFVIIRDLGIDVEIVFYLIIAILSVIASKGNFNFRLLKPEFILYLLVVITVQTIEYGPFYKTFIKGVFVLFSAIMCANYVTKALEIRMSSFLKGMISCIALCELYILVFAQYRDSQFEGMRRTLENFSASQVALAASLSIFWGFAKMRAKMNIWYLLVIVLATISVVASFSKSGMMAPLVVIFIFTMFNSKKHLLRNSILFGLVAIVVLIIFNSAFQEIYSFVENENTTQTDFTFNGRLPIWMEAYDFFLENPWFGNGYYHSQELLEKYTYNFANQAHSLYYQLIVSVGLVGTFSMTVYYIRVLFYIRRIRKKYSSMWLFVWFQCMCLYFLFRGITEASIAQCPSFDAFLFVIISMSTISVNKFLVNNAKENMCCAVENKRSV